jgi:hypothetical protein
MTLHSLNINLEKDLKSGAGQPEDNLGYFAPEVGSFWLQGKDKSEQADSRATFIWSHGLTDVDAHSQKLNFRGSVEPEPGCKFFVYHMQVTKEDSGSDQVLVFLADFDVPGFGYRIFYHRLGIDTQPILWTANARRITGHEDR